MLDVHVVEHGVQVPRVDVESLLPVAVAARPKFRGLQVEVSRIWRNLLQLRLQVCPGAPKSPK